MKYWIFGISWLVVFLMGFLAGVTIRHHTELPLSLLIFLAVTIAFFTAAAFVAASYTGKAIFLRA
jgi:hypothetical protein